MAKVEKKAPQRPKNPLGLWLGTALILFGLFAVVNGVLSLTDNQTRVVAPRGLLTVEVVSAPEDREKGLSGRERLAADAGMLFIFDRTDANNCFWMKDMNFSLDMVWLDENKQVVTVAESVSPETFPRSFCPDEPAAYGLELNENRAGELGIEPGETLRW